MRWFKIWFGRDQFNKLFNGCDIGCESGVEEVYGWIADGVGRWGRCRRAAHGGRIVDHRSETADYILGKSRTLVKLTSLPRTSRISTYTPTTSSPLRDRARFLSLFLTNSFSLSLLTYFAGQWAKHSNRQQAESISSGPRAFARNRSSPAVQDQWVKPSVR